VNSYRKSEVMSHSATCPRLSLEKGSLAFLASVLLVLCKSSASFLLYFFFTSFLQVRCRCSELCLACGAFGEYRARNMMQEATNTKHAVYIYIYTLSIRTITTVPPKAGRQFLGKSALRKANRREIYSPGIENEGLGCNNFRVWGP
jgi:hypothetical protein